MVPRLLAAGLGVLVLLAPLPGRGQESTMAPTPAGALEAEGGLLTGPPPRTALRLQVGWLHEAPPPRAAAAAAAPFADERGAGRPGPRPVTRRRLAAWITTGVAAAGLATALSLTGVAICRAEDLNAFFDRRSSSGQPVRYSEVASTIASRQRELDRLNKAIFATHLTWVVALSVSIYLWVTSRAKGEKRAPGHARLPRVLAGVDAGAAPAAGAGE